MVVRENTGTGEEKKIPERFKVSLPHKKSHTKKEKKKKIKENKLKSE